MAKLTNLEKYAIQGMLNDDKKSTDIAKAIGKPIELVDAYMTELNVSLEKVSKIKIKSQKAAPPKRINTTDVISKHTTSGQKLAGAMMNKAASERGDDFRLTGTTKPRNWDDKIHVINPEKK